MSAAPEPSQGHHATLGSYDLFPDRRDPAVRTASRVLVIDTDQRVLLFGARMVDLDTPPADVL